MSREYLRQEKAGADKMELEKFTLGSLRRAVFEGDTETGSQMAGQVCGMLNEVRPAAVILHQLWEGAVGRVGALERLELAQRAGAAECPEPKTVAVPAGASC